MNKKIKTLFSYLMIIIGAILASFSVACILLPNDAIDYGTAGIAIIISKLTGYNLSLCVLIVFLPFLIAGIILIGKYFFAKTFVGFVIYTIGLSYFEKIPFELNTEHFIAVAFGGAILGAGLSLILRENSLNPSDVLMIGDRQEKDGQCAINAGTDYLILKSTPSARRRQYKKWSI